MSIKVSIRKSLRVGLFKTLNEDIEEYDGYVFNEDYYDYNSGQSYIRCTVEKDGRTLAKADYALYQGKIYINHIESYVKGKGYGMMLMKHIASIYGYENMPATSLTPDGAKMRKKLDKHFNYTPKEINNHIPESEIEKIKSPLIKQFLVDMINMGYTATWEKWLQYEDFKKVDEELRKTLDIDFNEISDIAEWIQNSEDNNNDPEEEVPDVIIQDFQKLM